MFGICVMGRLGMEYSRNDLEKINGLKLNYEEKFGKTTIQNTETNIAEEKSD